MKFTIIVVAYERYNQIKCLLYSLLSQTYKNFEVIVIHDGYNKEHLKLMAEFLNDDRIKYFQTPIRYNDWGMSLRNIGISIAKGDFIINTNDDNYYVPVWLEELAKASNSNPSANFLYYDCVLSSDYHKNTNNSSYGLLIPTELKIGNIDMGQFAVKSELMAGKKFKISFTADGELVEELSSVITPVYINKVLFVHN